MSAKVYCVVVAALLRSRCRRRRAVRPFRARNFTTEPGVRTRSSCNYNNSNRFGSTTLTLFCIIACTRSAQARGVPPVRDGGDRREERARARSAHRIVYIYMRESNYWNYFGLSRCISHGNAAAAALALSACAFLPSARVLCANGLRVRSVCECAHSSRPRMVYVVCVCTAAGALSQWCFVCSLYAKCTHTHTTR